MKRWALYKDDNGLMQRIGINAALAREKEEPGKWHKRTYYSTHWREADRREMGIKRSSKNKFYFAYTRTDSNNPDGGGGESLQHYLYKVAVSELAETTLVIKSLDAEIPITITASEVEKPFHYQGNDYRLDVFIQFESEDNYGLKWDGELAIEICHTHSVKATAKQGALVDAGIPAVEVKVSPKLAYRTAEEDSTPETEREYLEFLKPNLTNFMWATMLSDPKSKAFLEAEIERLSSELSATQKKMKNFHALYVEEKQRAEEYRSRYMNAYKEKESLAEKNTLVSSELKSLKSLGVFKFAWKKMTERQ